MTLPGLDAATPSPAMSDADVQAAVARMLDQARLYSENTLSDFRSKALDYYKSNPFGNEVEGRSQFVVSVVKDTIQAILPSMMGIFSGADRPAEFRPRSAEDIPQAEQQTDLTDYTINVENPGNLIRYAAFKDAFLQRLGVVKYWWEPGQPTVQETYLTGVSPDQLVLLDNDPSVESGFVTATNPMGDQVFYDVTVRRLVNPNGRICVEGVPPDEFVFSPNAKSKDDALCVAHVTRIRRSDLIGMGYAPDDIDVAGVAGRARSAEFAARQPQGIVQETDDDPANPEIDYAEVYCYLDGDGDGVAENRRVVVLGASTVVANDPFDGRPFALYCTDPEPHSIVPQSVADGTMDLQLLESALWRAMLDSAAQTINPGYEVVEGQVRTEDLMNQEVGRVVRVRAPGMLRDLVTPYVGKEMFPMLMATSEMKENRFGISKASMGLNPDALQSSTKAAVAATVTGSQQHLKLMAMMLAEGERELYTGVRDLLMQHQDRPKAIRLRNAYVEIDPRTWTSKMDCVVSVGLGTGTNEERLAVLKELAAEQGAILKQFGPTNPLVTVGQYRETQAQILALSGYKDASKFWKDCDPNWEPPPPEPKPTPEETYAAIEQMKVQADIANKQATLAQQQQELALEAQKAEWDHEEAMLKLAVEREKIAAESGLREREIDLAAVNEEHRTNVEGARVEAPAAPAPAPITIVTGEQAAQMPAPVIQMPAPEPPPPVTSITVKRDKTGKATQYDLKREGK